jgi:hypothetical protein
MIAKKTQLVILVIGLPAIGERFCTMMTHSVHKIQAAPMVAIITLMLICTLCACGKKPAFVDPPPDVKEDHFPLVYPDPATDEKP